MCFASLATACGSPRPLQSPYASSEEPARDQAQAELLTRQAADLIATEPAKAEALLREALAADLFHGPAHNNLGVVFLESGKLYEAAHEFEWARKLMPGHPDPRFNLAITLELAGQPGESRATFLTALEVYPGHVPSMQGLARLTIKSGQTDERLRGWLEKIAMEGETAEWRTWATQELALQD